MQCICGVRGAWSLLLLLLVALAGGISVDAASETPSAPASTPPAPAVPQNAQAVGDLLVYPTRFVFDTQKRTAEVTLLNIGKTTATYRISLIHQRMSETGKMSDITTPDPSELFADALLHYTPRQVILEPHVAQVIRIQVRKPENLAAGEYRSHMLFRALPPAEASNPDAKPAETTMGVKLTAIYGVTIPIIVRHQTTPATVTMSDAAIASQAATPAPEWTVTVRLNRAGLESTYGDLLVTLKDGSHAGELVGKLGGVAVYTPNASRLISLTLHLPENVPLSGRHLLISYQQKDTDGGATLAQTTLDVP